MRTYSVPIMRPITRWEETTVQVEAEDASDARLKIQRLTDASQRNMQDELELADWCADVVIDRWYTSNLEEDGFWELDAREYPYITYEEDDYVGYDPY